MGPDDLAVEVRRRLAARPEKVFDAFADAALVSRWLKPAPEVGLTVLALDFRVGGAYRFAYAVPGGPTMIVAGVYRAIDPPTKIIFTWDIEPPDEHAGLQSEVTVTIVPSGDGSELCIRHAELGLRGAAARHAQGWQGALDRLEALVKGDLQ
jgi:uncharacterized protein YndB with AHSA1/START domain